MTGPLGAASPWPLIEWFEGCLRGSLAFLRLRVRLIRLRRCFVGSVPFPDRLVAGLYFLLSALARVAGSWRGSAKRADRLTAVNAVKVDRNEIAFIIFLFFFGRLLKEFSTLTKRAIWENQQISLSHDE